MIAPKRGLLWFVLFLPIGAAAQNSTVDSTHLARCEELLQLGNEHINEDSAIYYYKLGVDYGLQNLPKYHPIVGDIYNKLGIIYKYQRNHELAELYYQNSLNIRKNHFGSKHTKVSASYNNLGLLNKEMEQYPESERYFMLSLEIDREILGEEHLYIAQTLNNLGLLYRGKGEFEKSAEMIAEAVRMKEKLIGHDHNSTGSSYINLGIANMELENYPEAMKYFNAAKVIFQKLHNIGGELVAYENMGNTTFLMGKTDWSLSYYQQALGLLSINVDTTNYQFTPKATDLRPGSTTMLVLLGKSRSLTAKYEETKDLKYINYAIATYQVSFELIRIMLRDISFDESKQAFMDRVFWEYEKALNICYLAYQQSQDPSYVNQAFIWSEQSKSFLLLQSLRGEEARYQAGIPNSVNAQEKKLTAQIASLKSEIYNQRKEDNETTKLRSLQNELFETSTQFQKFLDSLRITFPEYYKLVYSQQNFSVADIQNELLDPNTSLIEYFIGINHQFIFQVTKSGLVMHHAENNYNDQINEFVGLIRDPSSEKSQIDLLSHQLYENMIAPLKLNTQVNRLLIVRDGLLNYVPFEILRSNQARPSGFLFEDFVISYQYSASVALESKMDRPLSDKDNYLAFAPEFNQRSDNSENSAYEGEPVRGSLMELQGTFEEVAAIARLLKGKYFKGELATENAFKRFSKDYDIIHLATHAIVDNKNPLNSRLLFTLNEDSLEDGDLYAWELYNMEFNAQMVVLSACNTGFGKLQNGEGVMSLGRAFAYAGCPSIVMSLWPAQDESTAEIMKYFYEGLSKGYSKDDALRQAKARYLESAGDLFSHPFYWAGFVVQGDPKPLHLKSTSPLWKMLIPLLLLIGLVIWIYGQRRASRN